jgi:hypothetical protein
MGSGMERKMLGSGYGTQDVGQLDLHAWDMVWGYGEVLGMKDRGVLGNSHVAEAVEPWEDVLVYIASWTQCEGKNEVMS